MLTFLQEQIIVRMKEKGLSVYALEKKAGLKRSAVRNILKGFSKKPSIDVVSAIAHALDCTLNDLIGNLEDYSRSIKVKQKTHWVQDLYIQAIRTVGELLKERNHDLSFEKILKLISEVYEYSLSKKSNEIDLYFSKWTINKEIKH